jgi:hypothetical protein
MRIRITRPNRRALRLSREEIALGVEPKVRAGQAEAERRRMNPFPGRALTVRSLTGEQAHRSWHIARLNRSLSSGIAQGLELAFADDVLAAASTATDAPPAALDMTTPRRLALESGLAVAASGEDLEVPSEVLLDALDLTVAAPQWLFDGASPPPSRGADELLPRNVGTSLRELLVAGRPVPRAGVIVLEPVEYESLLDPSGAAAASQCERDLEAEAFDDEIRQESARLVYYAWPEEWLPLPAADVQWRNRLAHTIFEREALANEHIRLPWWRLGVPLALVAFNAAWFPLFADRAAVARRGGAPRARLPLVPGRGSRFLWQARIEQLTEHIAEARAAGTTTAELAAMLRYLPPAGLLPRDAIDARAGTRVLFGAHIRLDAAPVPLEQLDALLEDSASGARIDLAIRDEFRVLVPIPQAVYEPELLIVERADADGEFARAIARFVDIRADWLRRRQSLREKRRELAVAIDGPAVPAVPSPAEDPLRLEPERIEPLLPAPSGVIHVSEVLAGVHQHFLLDAPAALEAGANDLLTAYVQLDRENPPREVMLQFLVNGRWEHRAYWGKDLIDWGVAGTASRFTAGGLPAAGEWMLLQVRASDVGLDGQRINGIAFTLFDGRAAWGPAGIAGQDPWLTGELISQSTLRGDGEGWTLVALEDANAPFEAAHGIAAVKGKRVVSEIEQLKADVGTLRIGPRGKLNELGALIETRGLRHTIHELKARIASTNDSIDLGFLRVQSDLYRLRQAVLKQSQATRFAVSPALTQIAELDSAVATREQLSKFYDDIKGAEAAPKPASAAPDDGGAPSGTSASLVGARINPTLFAAPSAGTTPLAGAMAAALSSRTTLLEGGATLKAIDPAQTRNLFGADALTGLAEVRNVSIAARMEQPRAIEGKNFTIATRIEVTQRLADAELDLEAIDVAGVPTGELEDDDGQPKRGSRKLTDIADFAGTLTDPSPDASKADEAHYFLGGVDVADFTIGLLRNFEGLVARYRNALERCERALVAIEANAAVASRRLLVVERELAEARQDAATARALLAEEIERVRAINARRDALIAEHVSFLAFARPRLAQRLQALPARELDNASEPDAVPACLVAHDDPPPEVQQMLQLIRRAPVEWFPYARGLFDLIDRLPHLELLARAVRQPLPQIHTALANPGPSLVVASQQVVAAQAAVMAQVREEATAITPTRIEGSTQRGLLARFVSLTDLSSLLENALVARRAAEEYERIATVAGCLHARLGSVKPALRLVWAERYSQFDAPADLGDLSLLPRLGEVPAELREEIIELARWLRNRARRDLVPAQRLINDLLRVCILAASHSPVNEIVTGRVLRPLPLFPGTLLPIRPLLPARVRLGQTVQFFDEGRLAATAIVDDLQAETATVRVTNALMADVQATEATVVRFVTMFG